jgi:asparagine synthase (glutamine-hydrolysing)
MCGIAGYLSRKSLNEKTISRMLEAIRHRGPDESSEYHFDNYHVGMTRLAINDSAHGSQPLRNGNRKVVVMYNGEIYNSPQLREQLEAKGYSFRTRSDGEVICHLYDEYKENLFGLLDGMFAIALWDESCRTLLLARDSMGEKPLYYSKLKSGDVVFASEIKAFRYFEGIDLTLNRQALWDYPTFLWIPEPATVYNEIAAIPRKHFLKVTSDSINLIHYELQLNNESLSPLDDNEAIVETRRIVDEAVRSRLLADVPIGSFLSGGLDSSIVTALAIRELGAIDTFSVSFDKIADPYHGVSDESEAAASFAQKLGSNHHTIRVTANSFRESLDHFCFNGDQPFAVSSGLGVLAVAKEAKKNDIKVLLSGDCADELFGGYSWYSKLELPISSGQNLFDQGVISYQNFGLTEYERLNFLAGYTAQQRAWAWHYYADEREKGAIFSREWQEGLSSSLRFFSNFDLADKWEPIQYVLQDRDFYLPNEMLRKLDRMTMAYSVEGRVPFAAPAVVRHAKRLNYSQMVRGESLKWVLRKAYADILPQEIIDRPKHGFNVPIDHWLQNEWHDLFKETFSPESALYKHGMLSEHAYTVAQNMLRDKERLNGHTLFCFMTLNRWLEKFN